MGASTDVYSLNLAVNSDGVPVASDRLRTLAQEGGRAESATNALGSSFANVARYIQVAAAALGAWKLVQYAQEATLLSARVETLGVVLRVVGNNAGYTATQMNAYVEQVKKMGITTQESMNSLIKMAGAQMDLSKAGQLARVAQDAAVIGNINSSEAFGRLIHGVRSGETETLRGIGINVQFDAGYKKLATTLGKTTEQLVPAERATARMNTVLEYGTNIAGAYEASLNTAGKQALSMARYTEELKLAFGNAFNPSYTVIIKEMTLALKDMNKQAKENEGGVSSFAQVIAGFLRNTVYDTVLAKITFSDLFDKLAIYLNGGWLTKEGRAEMKAELAAREQLTQYHLERMAERFNTTTKPTGAMSEAQLIKEKAAAKLAAEAATAKLAAEAARNKGAEEQSRLEKSLDEARRATNASYQTYLDALVSAGTKNRISMIRHEAEQGKISKQQSIEDIRKLEVADIQRKLDQNVTLQKALSAELNANRFYKNNTKEAIAQEVAQNKLNEAIIKGIELKDQLKGVNQSAGIDTGKVSIDQTKALLSAQQSLLSAQGQTYAAAEKQIEIDEIGRKTLINSTEAVDIKTLALLREGDALKLLNIQLAQEKTLADAKAINATMEADTVGRDAAGTITDQYAHDLSMMQDASNKKIEQLDLEIEAYERVAFAAKKGHKDEINALNMITQKEREKTNVKNKLTTDSAGLAEKSYKSQLSVAAQYTGMASQMFTALASTQDQTSRSGFESAKAFSLAAAVMNTAAAVMNAMATVPWPMSVAAAALAAATGAIQIATISATSFGGGGSVSGVSGGSFGGGSGSGGGTGVGSSIGGPVTNIQDNQTAESLQRLASSSDNASLAISKVADGLTKIGDLFETGYSKMFIGTLPTSPDQKSGTTGGGATGAVLGAYMAGPVGAIIGGVVGGLGNAMFGWSNKWYTTGGGFEVGLSQGDITNRNYLDRKKKGGWFSGDKYATDFSAGNPTLTEMFGAYLNQIKSSIITAAVATGSTANMGSVTLAGTRIATANRKPEDIQKDLENWFIKAADVLAQSVSGLKEFTFYGESAFDALVRLSTSLQGVNEQLELTGHTLISSTLAGANAAWKLADAFGGLDKMQEATDKYFKAMFSENEQKAAQAAQSLRQVNVAFNEMGIVAPLTREKFRAIVNGLDLTTDSGAAAYVQLMNVSEAFGTVLTQTEELAARLKQFDDDISSRSLALLQNNPIGEVFDRVIKYETELADARQNGMDVGKLSRLQGKELSAYLKDGLDKANTSYFAAQEQYNKLLGDNISKVIKGFAATAESMRKIAAQLSTTRNSLLVGDLSPSSATDKLGESRSQMDALYRRGRLGDQEALTGLSGAATSYLQLAQAYYASSPQYATEFNYVQGLLKSSEQTALSQSDFAQRQVDLQQRQLDALTKSDDKRTAEAEAAQRELIAQNAILREGFLRLIALAESSGGNMAILASDLRQQAAA